MSAIGSHNTKNPTIKRIHREALELSSNPSPDFTAAPQETNLFEWHFTFRGPPDSPYAGGIYHGRISLPPAYPLRPPAFRFLTPSGRFEVNREICLSISGHHEESWQPAWGIRTALVAMRSFMDTDAKGQIGGIDMSKETRMRFARESRAWRCAECAKTNEEIMQEVDEECARLGGDAQKEEAVPEELKLGYKDELGKGKQDARPADAQTQADAKTSTSATTSGVDQTPQDSDTSATSTTGLAAPQLGTSTQMQAAQLPPTRTSRPLLPPPRNDTGHWLDMAISGIAMALALMIIRKLVHYL